MVRLEITIKEISAIVTEVSIQEIRRKATKNEKEVSNILEKRLNLDEKFQVETKKDELKAELEKLLKSL